MPSEDLNSANRAAKVASSGLTPVNTRTKRKRKTHLPLLSRDFRDTSASDYMSQVEKVPTIACSPAAFLGKHESVTLMDQVPVLDVQLSEKHTGIITGSQRLWRTGLWMEDC